MNFQWSYLFINVHELAMTIPFLNVQLPVILRFINVYELPVILRFININGGSWRITNIHTKLAFFPPIADLSSIFSLPAFTNIIIYVWPQQLWQLRELLLKYYRYKVHLNGLKNNNLFNFLLTMKSFSYIVNVFINDWHLPLVNYAQMYYNWYRTCCDPLTVAYGPQW